MPAQTTAQAPAAPIQAALAPAEFAPAPKLGRLVPDRSPAAILPLAPSAPAAAMAGVNAMAPAPIKDTTLVPGIVQGPVSPQACILYLILQ